MHRARKRFGQHFLHDRQTIDRILRAIDPRPGDRLVEIGPGQGALTLPLLRACRDLTAIELDRDLLAPLRRQASAIGNLDIINADILGFDLGSLQAGAKLRLVGNLPYNISTPLMFHLIDSLALIQDMHFMLQKEVAQRIVAAPGDRHYGRLSVMLQYRCDCQYLFEVAPACFRPPPKVDSAVIRLRPLAAPAYDVGEYAAFYDIVQTAFGQRRKTIANSLKSLLPRQLIADCGIDPGLRAENLTIGDFARLSRART
jgi:16S rRNA (adenine1518-N6/adenine1519-N6)-dimethyltransferase